MDFPEANRKQAEAIRGNRNNATVNKNQENMCVSHHLSTWGNDGKTRVKPLSYLDMVGVTGSIPVAPTIHSSFSPTCGDLPNMPAIGGLFRSDVQVSKSSERVRGRIRGSVSAAEIPVPGAEKVWCKELHPEAVAVAASPGAGAKDAIRFAPDQAVRTGPTIRREHHASSPRRCREEADPRRQP